MFDKSTKHQLHRRELLSSASAFLGMSTLLHARAMSAQGSRARENSRASGKRIAAPLRKRALGFMLAHEQFTIPELVDLGAAAEQAGFDFVATSDHLQPWQSNEGHAGMSWITMSALGQRTHHLHMGTTVTCPTFRYNPAVVAQGFASLSLLYPGRIFLGVGSGEAINERSEERRVGKECRSRWSPYH